MWGRMRKWGVSISLYEDAVNGLMMLHKDVRPVISMALILYREILKVIEENGYDVYRRRAYVNTLRKVLIYIRLMFFGIPTGQRYEQLDAF
jgi:phytoene synthase